MRRLMCVLVFLAGCPTGSGEDCPVGVPLGDADMGCECAGEIVDSLPGCGDLTCTDEGATLEDEGCDTAGCKGVDCG